MSQLPTNQFNLYISKKNIGKVVLLPVLRPPFRANWPIRPARPHALLPSWWIPWIPPWPGGWWNDQSFGEETQHVEMVDMYGHVYLFWTVFIGCCWMLLVILCLYYVVVRHLNLDFFFDHPDYQRKSWRTSMNQLLKGTTPSRSWPSLIFKHMSWDKFAGDSGCLE